MKDIAREAGLAVGTFYLYFDDKRAVLEELMQLNRERTNAFIEQASSSGDALDSIHQVFQLSLGHIEEATGEAGLASRGKDGAALELQLLALAAHDQQFGAWIEDINLRWVAAFTKLITRAKRAGRVPKQTPSASAARSLVALLNGLGLLAAIGPPVEFRSGMREAARAVDAILGVLD